MLTGLLLCSLAAMVGGLFTTLLAIWRLARPRVIIAPLDRRSPEFRLLFGCTLAALLGCAWLFLAPAYSTVRCSLSLSAHTEPVTRVTREARPGDGGEIVETYTVSSSQAQTGPQQGDCKEQTQSYYAAAKGHRSAIIALFTLPVALTLVPLAFGARRIRPVLEGVLAMVLGGQVVLGGMSLYGVAFGPSALLMMLAALSGVGALGGRRGLSARSRPAATAAAAAAPASRNTGSS